MQKVFKLTQQEVSEYAENFSTPLLVLSLEQIERNYKFMVDSIPGMKLFYAIKSNPDENIIRKLHELGSNFDVASDGEIFQLTSMGISPDRLIYANPVKTPNGLMAAAIAGVNMFTFDSENEIYKMAKFVPECNVLLRVKVESDALIDLNKKFGASPEDAMRLLRIARDNGLNVVGLCFHVGSNCQGVKSYINALIRCRNIFDEAIADGFDMRILDIGGGFTPSDNLDENLHNIHIGLQGYFPGVEIWAEPGRFICGTSMNLITSVIGATERNNQPWYWLDDGIYGTFSAISADHWEPDFITFKNTEKEEATFAGPSCDSMDIIERNRICEKLEVGDNILVPNAGAYTIVTATNFNGFSKPRVVIY